MQTRRQESSRRHYHFWILAQNPETGKPYLIYGSPHSEEDCRQKGLEVLGGLDFEIRRLPTRDLGTASAMIRGKRLEETHSLGKASERLGHNRSLDRYLERKRERRKNRRTMR